MGSVGFGEIAVIVVVALIVVGPERLPGLAKQAAEFVQMIRKMANNARDDLRTELGPEYADLELRDLDPRQMVRKHLQDAWVEDDSEDDAPDDAAMNTPAAGGARLAPGERPPFDHEAT